MKTLTLRGIDEELAGRLERLARQGRESMNGVILHLLRDKLGLSKPKFGRSITISMTLLGRGQTKRPASLMLS